MANDYITNISNTLTEVLFYMFLISIGTLTFMLIVFLLFLIIGCLIKSQSIRKRFLKGSIGTLVMLILMIAIPNVVVILKGLM